MRECRYTSYDALPVMLTAPEVGEVLGISRAAAYELVRSQGFPNNQYTLLSLDNPEMYRDLAAVKPEELPLFIGGDLPA